MGRGRALQGGGDKGSVPKQLVRISVRLLRRWGCLPGRGSRGRGVGSAEAILDCHECRGFLVADGWQCGPVAPQWEAVTISCQCGLGLSLPTHEAKAGLDGPLRSLPDDL